MATWPGIEVGAIELGRVSQALPFKEAQHPHMVLLIVFDRNKLLQNVEEIKYTTVYSFGESC
jgi:hypothetical protein